MRAWQFYLVFGLSAACLASAYELMSVGKASLQVQAQFREQQSANNRDSGARQFQQALVRDLRELSVTNAALRELLTRHGYGDAVTPSSVNALPVSGAK